MNITISINNMEADLRGEVSRQVTKKVNEELDKIDIKTIIEDQVRRVVDVSPKVNEKQIKDFVRERIAKIITIDITKEL